MVDSKAIQWKLAKNLIFKNGPDVDRSVWQSPHWISPTDNPAFFGRTSIRNVPDYGTPLGYVPVVNGAAQLYLSTYNPKDPTNSSFLGAEISTIEKWGISEHHGVAFEANVVCPVSIPHGAVAAMFSYNLRSQQPFRHDEIDFEFASRWWSAATAPINTNVYVDSDDGTKLDQVVPSGANFANSITFRIEWIRSGIRWFVDGKPIRSEPQVPQSDMSLVLNFWAPSTTWPWAYSAALQPTGPQGEQQWVYQVNWAKVYTA
jgi:hypothetical protein